MVFAGYIVHIYRFKKDNPRSLVGVVEEVGVETKRAFTNFDELWEILNSSRKSTVRNRSIQPNIRGG